MPALPRFNLRLSLIVFSLSLFTLALASPVHAAPGGPPNPKPCENALPTEKLTDNYITDKYGNPPLELGLQPRVDAPRTGTLGESIPVSATVTFRVDFSKLQAVFAASNSNYLEGSFQANTHRFANILDLSSQSFTTFHGPGQKISPKVLVNELKLKYVEYVYNKPELYESDNKYTDIENSGDPKTIYDLVNEFGLPNPQAADQDRQQWLATWGRYWEKIPTAYREFYKGKLEFRAARNIQEATDIRRGKTCPQTIRSIEFVLPEFSRTVSVTDQLNKMIVPCAVQSYRHGDSPQADECGQPPTPLIAGEKSDTLLSSVIKLCRDLIQNSANGLGKTLKKAISFTLDFANPAKDALAAVAPDSCIKILGKGPQSSTPFCALPSDQYHPEVGDRCSNQNDPNKLDRNNPNVVCTFSVTFTTNLVVNDRPVNQKNWDDFDNCVDVGAGRYQCNAIIYIWPVFRIPLLSEIWNSTLYSDQKEGSPGQGVGSNQQSGRGGIYSFLTPQAISRALDPVLESLRQLHETCKADQSSPECLELVENCSANVPFEIFAECLGYFQKEPARAPGAEDDDAKSRFLGGVENLGRRFASACATRPRALQILLGSGCKPKP